MPRVSIPEFAKLMGVAKMAVQEAATLGRITTKRDTLGRRYIADIEKARREWADNTRPYVGPKANGLYTPSALALATQREREWRAKLAELEWQRKSAALVPLEAIRRELAGYIVRCKTRLLSIPTAAKTRIPHLSLGDIAELERLVNEALDELSEEGFQGDYRPRPGRPSHEVRGPGTREARAQARRRPSGRGR